MKLDIIIDSKTHRIDVPAEMLTDGESFYSKMDRDMDAGWQMGPEYIESPDTTQRCQIAANKLLVSVSAQNQLLVQLMAGYILKRLPGIQCVEIDTAGEMLNTEFIFEQNERSTPRPVLVSSSTPAASKPEPNAATENDVSQVYKVGKAYRFAIFDRATGQWVESPFSASEEEARRMRDAACARLVRPSTSG